jgi:hypothetical protein
MIYYYIWKKGLHSTGTKPRDDFLKIVLSYYDFNTWVGNW